MIALVFLAMVALGVACTTVGEGTDAKLPSGAMSPDAVEEVSEPARKSFTKDVLYNLLVAELAGQRDRIPVSAASYLTAATTSRDVAVARRATHIAILAKDWERGTQAAELWMELDPGSLKAKQAYATLLIRAERIEDAIPIIHVLIKELELPPDKRFLAVAGLLSQGKDEAASPVAMKKLAAMKKIVDKHIAEHPEDEPHALFALAHFLVEIKKEEQAIGLLERVIAMDAENTMARIYYAHALYDRGETEKALDTLSDALKNGADDPDIRLELARLSIREKQYEKAREQLQRVVVASPDNTGVRYTLILLLYQTERPDEARGHLRHLIGRENLTQELYFNLGQLAESQETELRADLQLAFDAYARVTHGQYYLDARLRMAALLAKLEDVEAARAHLHGILPESQEEAIRLCRMEGMLLADAGELAEAMSVYDAAIEDHPGDNGLLYARAMLGVRMGKVSILERDLRRLLARKPKHVDALNALGYTLADKTDRHQEAMELIQRAFALRSDSYYILDSMGWVLYRLGRHEESIGYLRRALAMQQDPEVAAHLGEVLWITGDRKAAREVWEAALRAAPGDDLLLEVMKRFIR